MGLPESANGTHIALQRCAGLVIVPNTPKGRGVFAAKDIPAKTVLDVCPVLVLGIEENEEHVRHTSLYHYTYNWPSKDQNGHFKVTQAVIFGLGSMFNHNRDQNVGWERDTERQLIIYYSLRDISVGEELCISYGDHLTFTDVDATKEIEGDGIDQLNQIQLD